LSLPTISTAHESLEQQHEFKIKHKGRKPLGELVGN